MAIYEAALICGFPYSGKTTLLQSSGEPFASFDVFLQERYETVNPDAINLKLSMEKDEALKAFAKSAKNTASVLKGKRLWIDGSFSKKEERLEMKNALHSVGFKSVGCLVLANVKISLLFKRLDESKDKFKCEPLDLMLNIKGFETPTLDERFAWIEFIQPADKSLREDLNWGEDGK